MAGWGYLLQGKGGVRNHLFFFGSTAAARERAS
jgi:hypothetical protein